MALTICKECGKVVSTNATVCANCGAPITIQAPKDEYVFIKENLQNYDALEKENLQKRLLELIEDAEVKKIISIEEEIEKERQQKMVELAIQHQREEIKKTFIQVATLISVLSCIFLIPLIIAYCSSRHQHTEQTTVSNSEEVTKNNVSELDFIPEYNVDSKKDIGGKIEFIITLSREYSKDILEHILKQVITDSGLEYGQAKFYVEGRSHDCNPYATSYLLSGGSGTQIIESIPEKELSEGKEGKVYETDRPGTTVIAEYVVGGDYRGVIYEKKGKYYCQDYGYGKWDKAYEMKKTTARGYPAYEYKNQRDQGGYYILKDNEVISCGDDGYGDMYFTRIR